MSSKKPNADKAAKHEQKGDEHLSRGKHKKALTEYKKALKEDPNHEAVLDKLIKLRDALPGEWDMKDFAESMSWVMHKQELENPSIKQVHARLSPEWEKATTLAIEILHASDESAAGIMIERLVGMGEIATRAVIGMLIDLKRASTANGVQEMESE